MGLPRPAAEERAPAGPRSVEALRGLVGRELGVSRWVEVDQGMIDSFAGTTGDRQWIHVDRERARRDSPTGGTIAHGFLTLSLVSALSYEIGAWPEHLGTIINYGVDRLRFVAPVQAGARVRLQSTLLALEERPPGRLLMRTASKVEIEGEEKPALVAETLVLLLHAPA